FFFSSRRRHTRFSRDWSSDVCSSDLYLILVSPTPFASFRRLRSRFRGGITGASPIAAMLGCASTIFCCQKHYALCAPPAKSTKQIGRASCRERVDTSVVDGAAS